MIDFRNLNTRLEVAARIGDLALIAYRIAVVVLLDSVRRCMVTG